MAVVTYCAVMFLVLSVLFGVYYYDVVPWPGLISTRIEWKYDAVNNDTHFMTQYLSSLERPVVITNSPFIHHEIMQWTFEGLAKDLQYLSCKYSKEPVFPYHAVDQPLNKVPEFFIKKPYSDVVISAQEFFSEIQSSSKNKYFYASGAVENLKLPLSFESLANISFNLNIRSGQVNYWFGGTNVTAYTHYDTSHNLHIVIRGRKRFILSPPSYSHDLFPCLHSLYRQTQVEILEPYLILDVLPGEVLYLPPYWFHRVVTVEPSISLNIWSDSRDFLLMEEVLTSPIPFEIEWGKEKLMQAAKYFIDCLIERLTLPKTFVKKHVLSRYKLLLANLTSDHELNLVNTVKNYCYFSFKNNRELIVEKIRNRAFHTAPLFSNMSSQEILEINFGNYIEHISHTILREQIIELPFFLKYCF